MRSADVTDSTAQTTGMQRFAAISGAIRGIGEDLIGETHVAARTASDNHHNGESDRDLHPKR